LQRLIGALGDPITSTSANLPGQPAAVAASEILAQWGSEIARGAIRLLDGGRLDPSPASTVVDCMGRAPRVIRPGAIPTATLREVVPSLVGDR
jgi:L-threonylcarbamoyladenylate synthase